MRLYNTENHKITLSDTIKGILYFITLGAVAIIIQDLLK